MHIVIIYGKYRTVVLVNVPYTGFTAGEHRSGFGMPSRRVAGSGALRITGRRVGRT